MKQFTLDVSFRGGKRIHARAGKFLIATDQAVASGGEGSAPYPFLPFLASIAACAGIYALTFCQGRKIPTDGMALTMACDWNEESKRYDEFRIDLKLPREFPDKYTDAVLLSIDLCAVKRHIIDPPEFEITASRSAPLIPPARSATPPPPGTAPESRRCWRWPNWRCRPVRACRPPGRCRRA